MIELCTRHAYRLALLAIVVLAGSRLPAHAQAALLVEEPYGFFGAINPTGHTAFYFERICAETPIQLRRCKAGELGAVVSRYQGIGGYDWVAIPLVPYLYSVENAGEVPARADHATVERLRNRYREAHLLSLGEHLDPGNLFHGGWTQLIGVSYERRIYAFRFATTAAEDDALIARLNSAPNRSKFELIYNNCADFARLQLNGYFPGTFHRSIFPDAGMTTPKQIAYKLVRYSRKHPEAQLTVFEIPQVPGFRRASRTNKDVCESLATTAYAAPIALLNPYIAAGLAVDYLARGRYRYLPRHPLVLTPQTLNRLGVSPLTEPGPDPHNPASAALQAAGAAAEPSAQSADAVAQTGLLESKAAHE